jgi:hypothetical protein
MATTGPYGVVTRFFNSPLITSVTAATVAARTMVTQSAVASQTLPVTLAPDPRWELDDPVEVVRDGERFWGFVTGVEFPLTVADGPMRMDVGLTL